jgi:hypothetical protein
MKVKKDLDLYIARDTTQFLRANSNLPTEPDKEFPEKDTISSHSSDLRKDDIS